MVQGKEGDLSVHVSERTPTPAPLRFLELASIIDAAATRAAANAIPKSYRFVLGVQMANAGNELAEYADLTQEFYPSSALAAYDRKRCLSEAIARAKTLKRLASKAVSLGAVPPDRFEELLRDIQEFIDCARGLKKAVKVKGEESVEDAIRWHKAQIRACDAIQSEDVVPC